MVQHYQPLMLRKISMSQLRKISTIQLGKILINQLRKISTSLLRKILKQNFKRLIWVRCNYNVIPDGVSKYILITLINKMRFGDITLSWVHTNLVLKNFKNLKRVEDFKVFGMNMIALSRDLNILLKKMLFFFFFKLLPPPP